MKQSIANTSSRRRGTRADAALTSGEPTAQAIANTVTGSDRLDVSEVRAVYGDPSLKANEKTVYACPSRG
ncbi:MAG: hypothetical protein ACRDL4_09315, partial [Thermoleophilaceae bacterium]